ncbi:NACHT, LRR and PYD domains-containing protein 12-like [Spea bombifrons]|uniref:NACHT, LRR and PYD domains-containing protein 12-like n=1 Tax=Spea bombifrons TaxID=233779 RepID=UPI00234AED23|nr:NACHT, LRR and PYD domains-containing protein 12-like [Spea bombifrons]
MRNKFQCIEDRNARLGERVHLTSRYTRLLMIKKHRTQEEREHEITSSGKKHLQIMMNRSSNEYSPTAIGNLFDPDEEGKAPGIVVLQGPAGIGKTMTAQKIMLDWASGGLYNDTFNYVFYLSCREINTIRCKISLAGLISKLCQLKCPHNVINSICSRSSKNLFIVDGFDELAWSFTNETEVCEDPFQETTKEIILNSLFRKQVLEKSSLVITIRPFTLEKLREVVKFPRYVEVLGFTEHDREEYFHNFFDQKEWAEMALNIVRENETLYTMCAVPITCWIVCTVLKQKTEEELNEMNSRTLTSIYLLYLKSLLKYHSRTPNVSMNSCMKRLSALAKDGIWDQKILFEEEDIRRHGLTVSDIESVFLNENVFQRDIETYTCYSFIHLSVQEFFAALHYVLIDEAESRDPAGQREVSALLKKSETHPHVTLTVRFLFGLSNGIQRKEIERLFGCPMSDHVRSVLEGWLNEVARKKFNETLHCLCEAQDGGLVERVMSNFSHVDVLSYINLRAISYCLVNSLKDHSLAFKHCTIDSKAQKILSPALQKCVKLSFHCCHFGERAEEDYGFKNKTSLAEEYSFRWLCNSQSNTRDFSLKSCHLSPASWRNLLSAAISHRFLVVLNLSCTELQDSIVHHLCTALRHPDSTLRELELEKCGLTSASCEELASVLIKNHSLLKLRLGLNKLTDSGIQHLCEGLKHPDCTLQELSLLGCDLTSASCVDLGSALARPSLRRLDLRANKLNDPGMKSLCAGLIHPDCALRDLRLNHCSLTSLCCEDLGAMMTKNRSLTSMNLAFNDLKDLGVRHLCKALRHPDCILQELTLSSCGLTSSCCEDLKAVIILNRSLTQLHLRHNKLEDSGLRLIYAGIRHPDCTLQTLRLEDNAIDVDNYRRQIGLPSVSPSEGKPEPARTILRVCRLL